MQDAQDRQRQGAGLLTAAEVGNALGIDPSTVCRMASDGRLDAVKIGRQWRFPAAAVETMLGKGVTPNAPDPLTAHAVITVAADLLGVMMAVTDMNGWPLTPVAHPCPRFAALADDPAAVEACAAEWRALAGDLDFQPTFRVGPLGFECARSYIRSGDHLVGMVLAGGQAPPGTEAPDLFTLDAAGREAVLAALRRIAATLSTAEARPRRRSTP